MSEEKAIIVQDFDVSGTAIEMYGGRSMVRELTSRLMGFHPAAKEVGEAGMLAIAQLAVLVGANPLPSTNEIHVWAQGNKITIDLGINYFRRRANELGGIYWVEQPRIMTDAEYQRYGIDARQVIGAICRGARVDKIRQLLALGLNFDRALEGNLRVGIGTVGRGATAKQGRPLSWTALKACEKDLCRELFPNLEQPDDKTRLLEIVPNVEPEDHDWPGETLNGVEAENLARLKATTKQAMQDWDAMTPEEQAATAEGNSKALYGDPDFEGFDTEPAAPPPLPDEPDSEPHEPARLVDVEPVPESEKQDPKTGPMVTVAAEVGDDWGKLARQVAETTGYYLYPGTTEVNWFHIRGAAAKLGFKVVTAKNLDNVVDALRSHAEEKQAEEQALKEMQPALI